MPRRPLSPFSQLIQESKRPRTHGNAGSRGAEPGSSRSKSKQENIFNFEQDTQSNTPGLTKAEEERFRREVPFAFFSERKPTLSQKPSAGSSDVAEDMDNSGQGSMPGTDLPFRDTVPLESTSHSGVRSESLPELGSEGSMKEYWKRKGEMASETQRADEAMESGGKVTDAKTGEMEAWLKVSEDFRAGPMKPREEDRR